MQALLNYIKDFWFLFVLLIIAIVAFLFVFSKASKSLARTRAEKERLIKKLDRMKKIREKYADLTEEKIFTDESDDLLDGVTDNIQQRLEKNEDMATAFDTLNEEEKLAYAFFYFLDETEKNASEFFKAYTRPLTPYALKACEKFCDKELYLLIKKEYDAYDEDNEAVSVVKTEIDLLDEKIKQLLVENELKLKACAFIKENAQKFV